MKQILSKSKSTKGRKKKTRMHTQQERKNQYSTQREYANFTLAREGVASSRNNRITESAKKEGREAKKKNEKSEEDDSRNKPKNDKTKRKGNTENETKERRKKIDRKAKNCNGVRAALFYLLGSQRGGGINTMVAIPRWKSVGQTTCYLLYTSPSPRDKT